MKKIKLTVLILITLLIATSLLTGCVTDSKQSSVDKGEEFEEKSPTTKITLYFMKSTKTSFQMEKEIRKVEGPVTAKKIAEELLKGPESAELSRIIPEGTKLLGIEIKNNIAYLNLSSDILRGNYGSESESILINSIVWTFTELPEVDAVQILVEGEKVETLGGHMVVLEPLTRSF